ncbi:DUF4244 domain-containing protein [Citricoccus sp. K5]|uniref:DUF4244 domain-containing protein n=1 Tax=Citricoccus sp. K5 TaxID=2653135 RepID=UPI0012F0FD53|nr:DUF4244 domain-containing protein [Citricoccus sp. K5]VXB77392.1 conserved hypothetical protein [Citricoccus sp. K5]
MTATLQHEHHAQRTASGVSRPATVSTAFTADSARPVQGRPASTPDWGDETGAQTAEYGIVTLAAVGFAGVLAVVLAGTDVQGLLLDIVKNALSFG